MAAAKQAEGLRALALKQAATIRAAAGQKNWLEKIAESQPTLAKEIEELIDDYCKGGEIAKAFGSQAQFARFLAGIEGVGYAPHTITQWITRYARAAN